MCVWAIKKIILSPKGRRFLPWKSEHIGYGGADKNERGLAIWRRSNSNQDFRTEGKKQEEIFVAACNAKASAGPSCLVVVAGVF